jgi:hypothetical protein
VSEHLRLDHFDWVVASLGRQEWWAGGELAMSLRRHALQQVVLCHCGESVVSLVSLWVRVSLFVVNLGEGCGFAVGKPLRSINHCE